MSEFVDSAWLGLSSQCRGILDRARYQRSEEAALEAYWRLLGPGGEGLEGYARAVPYEGAGPEDYAHREITLPGGLRILGGLHVFGLDPARPFVNIRATTRPLSPHELGLAARALKGFYPGMAPQVLRFWSAMAAEATPEVVVDQRLMVGALAGCGEAPPTPGLRLDPDDDALHYASLKLAFEAFAAGEGAARPFLRFISRGDYQDAAKTGCLRVASLGGEMVGLIAATKGEEAGIEGWVMLEEFITPKFQGRGLGKAMQRAFLRVLRSLDPEDDALVLGTIDGRNEPSIKTALACGRREAGAWLFTPGRP